MTGRFILRCLALVYAVVVLAGVVILLWPEQPATPLLDREGWTVTGGFFTGNSPNALEVRKEILASPETVGWRSWSPATQASIGRVESAAFRAPPFMAIPVGGFPGEEPGMAIYLQRVDTGERLPIANARMNTQWAEVDLHVPDDFRAAPVRLIAESGSTRKYVSVGTPFKISRVGYLKSRVPALLGLHTLGLGLFLLVVFACQVLASQFVSDCYGFPLGLAGACLAGYLAFFGFFFSPVVGQLYAIMLMLGSVLIIWLPRLRPIRSACLQTSKDYYAAWFLVSMFYVLVLYLVDTGAGSWHANSRFMPVRWSTDNQFPLLTAEQVFQGKPLRDVLAPWHVSDRPPLLAGLLTLARVPLEALIRLGLPNSTVQYYGHIVGIVANSLWASVLLFGMRRAGVGRARSLMGMFVAAFLPFTIFNSVYIWPKLLGGSLALLSFLVLLDGYRHRRESSSPSNVPFYVAALLAALALMTHGGTVFGLAVIALWPVAARYRPSPRHVLGVAALGIAVIAPWLLWQRQVDPPGDTLTKYAFTGSFHFDEPNAPLLQTVREAYGRLTFPRWLTMKKESFALLLGSPNEIATAGLDEMAVPKGISLKNLPQQVRGFFFFFPSLGLLPLVLVAFAATRKNWKTGKIPALTMPTGFFPLLTIGTVSLVVTVLVMWPLPTVHQLPYQAELAIILALLLLLSSSSWRWAALAGFLIVGHGLLVWIVGPTISALRYDQMAVALLAFWGLWTTAWIRVRFREDNAASAGSP